MQERVRISKNKELIERVCCRLKFVFGRTVKTNQKYSHCVVVSHKREYGECETLYFDEKHNMLVVYACKTRMFLFCCGDMVAFHNALYVDNAMGIAESKDGFLQYIKETLGTKNVSDVQENDIKSVLCLRFYRVPVKYLTVWARCYMSLTPDALRD